MFLTGEQSAVLTFKDNEEYKRRVLMETANEMKQRQAERNAQHDGDDDEKEVEQQQQVRTGRNGR